VTYAPSVSESVWDYPRPPRLEPSSRLVRVVLGGGVIAETRRAHRVLETSHPPVFYIPRTDVRPEALVPSGGRGSFCEFKGTASYVDVIGADGTRVARAGWSYAEPTAGYEAIAGALAFYPSLMDDCTVDDERVQAQDGDFYGGWITSEISGPFKGAPGTLGW
jgi:uncharacterized protein (DUF427 family)